MRIWHDACPCEFAASNQRNTLRLSAHRIITRGITRGRPHLEPQINMADIAMASSHSPMLSWYSDCPINIRIIVYGNRMASFPIRDIPAKRPSAASTEIQIERSRSIGKDSLPSGTNNRYRLPINRARHDSSEVKQLILYRPH